MPSQSDDRSLSNPIPAADMESEAAPAQMPAPEPAAPAKLKNKTIAPKGAVPRRAQQYIVYGIATLIVLIALFASHSNQPAAPRDSLGDPANHFNAPSPGMLAQYRHEIEAQQREDVALRARADALQPHQAIAASGGSTDLAQSDPLIAEERERRYHSLFASNIALAYGPFKPQPPAARPAEPVDPAAAELQQLMAMHPVAAQWPAPARSAPRPAADRSPAKAPRRALSTTLRGRVAVNPPGRPQTGQYVLFEGTILDAVLLNRLVGDFAGPVECMVTHDVYAPDREHLLIPMGARILGMASQVSSFGQRRLAVSFDRLLMPDGASYNLDKFAGLDPAGATGLTDKVNHHYLQVFGSSMAIGLLGGAAEASTNAGYNMTGRDMYVQGVGSGLSQASMQSLNRFLNVMPTITIREGHRVEIFLTSDLMLPVYRDQD